MMGKEYQKRNAPRENGKRCVITARAAAKEITSEREIQRNAIATKNTRRSSAGRR